MNRFTRLLQTPNVIAEHDAVVQPIYQSSIFRMPSHRVAVQTEAAVHPSSYYTRWGNPTVSYLEKQLSTVLGYDASLVFPSGMAAITCTILTFVSPGDLIAVSRALYGDSTRFFLEEVRRWGVRVALFDPAHPVALPALLEQGARLVYYESISNPELYVADLQGIRAACEGSTALTVCDCTFSPPGVLCPSVRPADLCIHSLTKYMSGHYSVFGGSVSGEQPLIDRMWHKQSLYGSVMDPHAAWQISQGLKTLELRLARQSATAQMLAQHLAAHPWVEQIFYPLLDSRPGAASAAEKYLTTGGGVISLLLKGGEGAATRLIEKTAVFGLSVSLGGICSCIEHAQSMSHSMLDAIDRDVLEQSGSAVPPAGLVRLSVGIEDPEDLLQDLVGALACL